VHTLQLAANPQGWRIFTSRKNDPSFMQVCQEVWARDLYTCQFCGFKTANLNEVINLDQNYENNVLTNLVTACCFCAQCFFLESVEMGVYGGGTLIYLPELSQNHLNGYCHSAFAAITQNTEYKGCAHVGYRRFMSRSKMIEKWFGTSEPAVFGRRLVEINSNDFIPLLERIRLLPSRVAFEAQLKQKTVGRG
jgi:intracellular multiplication protein IcmJ